MTLLLGIIALVLAVIIHEVAHGFIADHLGDPTARVSGRLTFNPKDHIDPVGSILLPLFLIISRSPILFGWAKPVPVDPFNLRNPKRDMALVSFAGPASNLLFAIICSVLLRLILAINLINIDQSMPFLFSIITIFLIQFIRINVVLAIFNLLPIHPLDGFAVVRGILPDEYAKQWEELKSYGMIFLIFLIFPFGRSSPVIRLISPIINGILSILLPIPSLI